MKIKKDVLAVIFILLVNCLLFFKIFQVGQFPVPGDLLVSFYFPWSSGEWEGYSQWTTRKELLSADAVRQIYIWKDFAAQSFKSGQVPLWNPYTFSGQPLLANIQSSVFYPLNALYLVFDARIAWVLLIVSQPALAGIFLYIFCRSLKISRTGSLLSATAFMFSSYVITWLENGNIIHSYLFLPLILFSCQRYFQNYQFRYLLLGAISLALCIFAGHPQTAIYLYTTFTAFWLYKWWIGNRRAGLLFSLGVTLVVSVGLAAIQLLPTYAFYQKSPVSLNFSKAVFDQFLIPYQNLVTFLAPDFFGHPATNNFWSRNYGDFNPYIGVVPLILAFYGFLKNRQDPFIKFGVVIGVLFFLASIASPVSFLVKTLKLPILDSTSSARFISITLFVLVIFAGFGFDSFLRAIKDTKTTLKLARRVILAFGIVYILLWSGISVIKILPITADSLKTNLAVTQRNLLLPTLLYSCFLILVLALYFLQNRFWTKHQQTAFIVVVFALTLAGGLYFSNKYLPSAPLKYIFPEHKIFTYLQKNAGINRIEGFGTAYIDRNFLTVYKLFSPEGYDTLRLKRYAELVASSVTGSVPDIYSRSDATLPEKENEHRMRLMDLLGVKYIVDKEDNPKTAADWHYERFTPDKLKGIWQDGKFQIYNRETAIPRFFVTADYIVAKYDKEIISKIYDRKFNLKTIILEENPSPLVKAANGIKGSAKIKKYEPNVAMFEVDSSGDGFFFLSDSFDPDWQAYVNGKKTKIYRANYTLRAVAVSKGKSQVRFQYAPPSFTIGASITFATIFLIGTLSIVSIKRKTF